jgi:hypothetical protein
MIQTNKITKKQQLEAVSIFPLKGHVLNKKDLELGKEFKSFNKLEIALETSEFNSKDLPQQQENTSYHKFDKIFNVFISPIMKR